MERSTRGGKTYVHTPEEARQLVAEMAALGVDGIKAHVVASSDIYRAIVEAAAQHNLPFDGHAPLDHNIHNSGRVCEESECWSDFRSMGVPALTHVEELVKMAAWTEGSKHLSSDEAIGRIAQEAADDGLWVTTSVFLMRSIADQASDLEGTLARMPEAIYVHPLIFDLRWRPGANSYADLGSQPWYPNYLVSIEKMLLALSESGVLLMSGTDVPVPLTVPGFSLHDELETMADIGLSAYAVLRTSTYNPALYLDELDVSGTVEEGNRADLVLLEGNPLEDIAHTRQIAGVMVRGRYYARADLDLILDAVARDYEAERPTQTAVKIAFPIAVLLLLAALAWLIVRRVRRGKASR
jgi:hypothetical protein